MCDQWSNLDRPFHFCFVLFVLFLTPHRHQRNIFQRTCLTISGDSEHFFFLLQKIDPRGDEGGPTSNPLLPPVITCQTLSDPRDTDENYFHPELFGLLDNPGVARFGCLDYPLAVTEDSHQEYETENEQENGPYWIRLSCDDLTHQIDGFDDRDTDRNLLHRSLGDIYSVFSTLHEIEKHTKM